MAKEKKHRLRVNVQHTIKGGKKWKLPQGCVCPPELVNELDKQGLLILDGEDDVEAVAMGEAMRVGEAGEAGVPETLPTRDGLEEEQRAETEAKEQGVKIDASAKRGPVKGGKKGK